MKSTLKTVVYLLVLFSSINLFAGVRLNDEQINKGKEILMQAYMSYSQELLLNARTIFEDVYNKNKSNLLPLYYITVADYKLLEMSLGRDETMFDKYYDNAVMHADKLSGEKSFSADGKIILAAIYMMKIANSSMSAVTLSPKIHSLLDEAQNINPAKPYSYIIRGMMKFNTPAVFGGSYDDALKNFNQAIKLFDNSEQPDQLTPDWGYVEALAWKGRTLEELENYEAAEFTYKKALAEQPEFGWVKNVLLPNLTETISKK